MVGLRSRLERAAAALAVLGPVGVLQRGYAICRRQRDGAVVASVGAVQPGEEMAVTVTDGNILTEVRELQPEQS